MVKSRLIILAAVLGLSWIRLSLAAQETLTIQTYYPAPYGAYDQLTTAGNTYLATDSGNVGIGTTGTGTYGSKLAVSKSNIGSAATISTNSMLLLDYVIGWTNDRWGVGWTRYGEANTRAGIFARHGGTDGSGDDTALEFYTNSNNAVGHASANMVLNESGNVGIGTTSPDAKLAIKQDGSGSGNYQLFLQQSNANHGYTLRSDAANGHLTFSRKVDAGYTETVRFEAGGNVGIGTTSPSGKLDVNGSIYQRGSSLHADYVFEPEYGLESIEEHSEYMWREKHLKAVPRAQKDEGGNDMVEYGARNRGVLEELEKAHVYIQQLNERIKLLEARLSKVE